MGILDEAIRAHLDLKRRRGADPEEVARQEGEVFGPPRRVAEASSDAPPDELPAEAPQAHLRLAEEASEPEAAESEAVESELLEPEAPPEQDELLAQETRAFDAAEVREAVATDDVEPDASAVDDEAAEDVLEETPEFLAETPEHDRLWFEQRPPRDFDF